MPRHTIKINPLPGSLVSVVVVWYIAAACQKNQALTWQFGQCSSWECIAAACQKIKLLPGSLVSVVVENVLPRHAPFTQHEPSPSPLLKQKVNQNEILRNNCSRMRGKLKNLVHTCKISSERRTHSSSFLDFRESGPQYCEFSRVFLLEI